MTKKHDAKNCPDCQEAMEQMREWLDGHAENVEWMCEEFGMEPLEARLYIRTLELQHTMIDALEWMVQNQLPRIMFTSATTLSRGKMN